MDGDPMDSRYDFSNRCIYSLLDPRDDEKIVYVGQSINPENRYDEHLKTKSENIRKDRWIEELKELGLQPILKIEKELWTTQFIAFESEMCVIVHYRDLGYDVLSVSKSKLHKIYCLK